MPSHMSFVEPLGPLWPSWIPMRAGEEACTKSQIRFQAVPCSSDHSPAHPGVMRARGETQTISVITRPAPPSALPPRWTKWKSLGMPSCETYMSMGETTTRLARSSCPSRNGANIGGHASPVPCPASS